jgi:transglutaminase-like putative cysteine protease
MARTAAPAQSVERFFQFSLLGLLASGYLAVVGSGHLDVPTVALTAAGLILRALLVAGVVELPLSDRWVTAITLAYMGFYPLDYKFLSREFLPATVHLVFFLAVIRVLTARTNRDYIYVQIIAFLELLAASVLSNKLNYFVFLALFLLFTVATFASWEIRRSIQSRTRVGRGSPPLHWRLASLTVLVSIGILSLTAGLFFVLPRTARAAFQHLVPERYQLPVFSNQVTLGRIGEIRKQSTVLMHARISGTSGHVNLKWRGMALAEFDGRRWFNSSNKGEPLRVEDGLLQLVDDNQRRRKGGRLSYEVHVRGFVSDALFIAGLPEFIRIDSPIVIRTPTDSYRLGYRMLEGLRYFVYSYLDDGRGDENLVVPPLPPDARRTYLSLPPLDARIARLARDVTVRQTSDLARARALESYLRTSFSYTEELPSEKVADPLAYFLFVRRKGHCEYFASAMAVMLRTIGIPSRVATGFQSGVYNPISDWYVIRASDAHSWVEAYIGGRGWTTFDPTPPDPSRGRMSLWSKLGFYLDAADTFWQEWVLNYDLDRQLTLAARMDQSRRHFSTGWYDRALAAWTKWRKSAFTWTRQFGFALVLGLVFLVAAAFAGPKLRAWWKSRQHVLRVQRGIVEAADATLLYQRALKILKRRGFEKPAWLTPHEFARNLPASEAAALVTEFTAAYNDLRFGQRREAAPRMMCLLEELERAPVVRAHGPRLALR